jgi:hypothetical protein
LPPVAWAGNAEGLLIVKDYSWDPDTKVKAIEYTWIERFNTVYNFRTTDGERRRVVSGLVVREIIYSEISCPAVLINQEHAAQLSARIATIVATISKWPASKSFLSPFLQLNQSAASGLERG